eukprot:173279_1
MTSSPISTQEMEKQNTQLKSQLTEQKLQIEQLLEENKMLKEKNDALEKDNIKTKETNNDGVWEKIEHLISAGDTDNLKRLIKLHSISMTDTDSNGNTIFLQACDWGRYDIAQLCLNLGSDINHKNNDGQQAIDLARDGAWYHIEQLCLFAKMNANLGDRVRDTTQSIFKQNGIVQIMWNKLKQYKNKKLIFDTITDIMIQIIKSKIAFSDDLLLLSWKYITEINKNNPTNSTLWKTIKQVCSEVIESNNPRDWYWLRQYMLRSTIWFKSLITQEDDERQLLFHELIDIVRHQSVIQQKVLSPMQNIASQNEQNWLILCQFGSEADNKKKCRQDQIPNGVEAKYSHKYLTNHTSHSSAFNSYHHYDLNFYLSELIMTAHFLDDAFQSDVQCIMNIDKGSKENTDLQCKYSRGPVKLISRCKQKVESDYRNETFPTSACILDMNRCTLVFGDVEHLIKGLHLFENQIKYCKSDCIIDIVRIKNGFQEYKHDNPQYTDIKVNVLIKSKNDNCNIIGEVQFMLDLFKKYKNDAHNLYFIERELEFVNNLTHVMPMILDLKKYLFVNGNLGATKNLFNLMVTYDKTEHDLMEIDKESGECIFHNMFYLGHARTIKTLRRIMGKQLFFNRTFVSQNRYNMIPIEGCCSFEITKFVFDDLDDISLVIKNPKIMFRILYGLFGLDDDSDSAQFVRSTIQLTDDMVMQYVLFDEWSLLSGAVHDHAHIDETIKYLLSLVDKSQWFECVHRVNPVGTSPFYAIVHGKRFDLVRYIMSGIQNDTQREKLLHSDRMKEFRSKHKDIDQMLNSI